MKAKVMICVMLCGFFLLSGCTKEKNFVGTWEADLFDIVDRDAAGEIVGEGAKILDGKMDGLLRKDGKEGKPSAFSGLYGSFAGMIADQLHWNATLEIREDGTLTMSNGMDFTATWTQEGDKIRISGEHIAGTATLSGDQKTLIFNNTLTAEDPERVNGFVFGSNSIDFEFTRKE